MSEITLYVIDKKNLSLFQSDFLVIFHAKSSKNVTICTKLTFQEVQKQKIIHTKPEVVI